MIHKSTKILLIETALAIITFLLMTSCSARKVNKSTTETKETAKTEIVTLDSSKTTTNTNENVKVITETKVDTEKNVVTEVTEITPLDATKKATITDANGKTIDITNAKYRNEKKTDLSKEKKVSISEYNKLKTSLEIALKQHRKDIKIIKQLKAKSNIKNIDKEQFNLLSFWWVLIPIALCYLYYKKYGFSMSFLSKN
jgi:hypothetical protein